MGGWVDGWMGGWVGFARVGRLIVDSRLAFV